jgi:hypothetical protein
MRVNHPHTPHVHLMVERQRTHAPEGTNARWMGHFQLLHVLRVSGIGRARSFMLDSRVFTAQAPEPRTIRIFGPAPAAGSQGQRLDSHIPAPAFPSLRPVMYR